LNALQEIEDFKELFETAENERIVWKEKH